MKRVFSKMTKSNRLHAITKAILVLTISIAIVSCSKDDDGKPPVIADEISQEIKELVYFKGDERASTVLITIPGGPSTEFGTDLVDEISATFNRTDLLTVAVHQAQTLDSTIVKDNDITLDEAITFNTESIEMLYKTIRYFKNEGRTVYVLGLSFGAFVAQELIAKKGIDVADNFLIMTGRLDMNDLIWQGASEGRVGYFENGVTPILKPDPEPIAKERNLNRISAGFSMNRYTELFSTIGDLSNITYVYGETDEAVGGLTPAEVQFLRSKNANILSGRGNHEDTIGEFIIQGFSDAFGIEL